MSGRSRYRRAVSTDKCYACVHVMPAVRPVLYIASEDGDLMLSCGVEHAQSTDDWKVVHRSHLTEADVSVNEALDLADGEQAERLAVGEPWVRGPITD